MVVYLDGFYILDFCYPVGYFRATEKKRPLESLKTRLALGEITKEEYQEQKRNIKQQYVFARNAMCLSWSIGHRILSVMESPRNDSTNELSKLNTTEHQHQKMNSKDYPF